jgi:hypothetical protein
MVYCRLSGFGWEIWDNRIESDGVQWGSSSFHPKYRYEFRCSLSKREMLVASIISGQVDIRNIDYFQCN